MRSPEKFKLAERPNVLITELDVQKVPTIEKAIALGIERFGRIDAVVIVQVSHSGRIRVDQRDESLRGI